MRKTKVLIKGEVIGIIFLFVCGCLLPCLAHESNVSIKTAPLASETKTIESKTAKITCYAIGMQGAPVIHSRTVTKANAEWMIATLKSLKSEMSVNPQSEKTKALQNELLVFAETYHLLPQGVTAPAVQAQLKTAPRLPNTLLSKLPLIQGKSSEWFCNFATVGKGAALPIIILPRFIPILLMPIPRAFVYWSTPDGYTSVGGLISRTGFIAYGKQKGIAIGFWGIGFSVFLPPIDAYGIFGYAIYTKVTAELFEFWPPNSPPEITQTDPVDGQKMVPISTTELRFSINDQNGDLMSYNVTTNPDIGSGSAGLKPSGIYSIPVSGLESFTQYIWHIQVTDGKDTVEKTLTFTTEPIAPVISNPFPADNAQYVPVETSNLSFDLKDYQGDLMNWTVETQPNIGSGVANGVGDGRYTVAIDGLDYFTSYKWFVNATDGEHWMKKTFLFKTIAENTLVLEPTDDTGIMENHPYDICGDSELVALRSGAGWEWDILIKFDISSIPSNATIQYASLQGYYDHYYDGNPSGHQVNLYRITSDWNEETVTWATHPSYVTETSSSAWVPSMIETWMMWNVTGDILLFYNSGTPNQGWRMVDVSGGYECTYLRTKEYSADHPVLIIGYKP
jgi:hypothetical protein